MKTHRLSISIFFLCLMAVSGWLAVVPNQAVWANSESKPTNLDVISEATGMQASLTATSSDCTLDKEYEVYLCPPTQSDTLPIPDPVAKAQAMQRLGTTGVLLVPDSTNDRVMAFDPTTGDLIDADFIPADPTNLTTPKSAILSTSGTILVADQVEDVVQEYDLDGIYLGIFAPAGGANNAILDNILGLALRPNGNLLVTVTSGSNQDSVAEFDTSGNYLGNFIAIAAGGMDGPFDMYERSTDWLVSSINSDDINAFDLTTGAFISEFAPMNDFPQQLAGASNSNILVGNFSGTQEGVVELTPAGVVVDVYNPPALGGYRGAYELGNGNILTTNGSGVHEIDRSGNLVETKIAGVSGQYIEFIQLAPSITLNKTVGTNPAVCATTDSIAVLPGSDVTYCYTVQNTGPVALTRHDLADSELGTILTNFPFTLMPGASAYLTQTTTILTDTTNIATWTAYNPGPTDVVSATDSATVQILLPEISLAKTVGTDPGSCAVTDYIGVMPGTEVTYCYEITNTGAITLTVHDLVDSELGALLTEFPYTLTPGTSAYLTQTVIITQTTINTATWTAYNPGPVNETSSTDTATVEMFPYCPAGYTPVIVETVDFESLPPPDWTLTNTTTGCTAPGVPDWTNTDPGSRGNLTGGQGAFAIADSDACGSGSVMTATMATGALDFTGIAFPQLSFYMDYNDLSSTSDLANVDASTDGGSTWENLLTWNADARGPRFVSTPLPGTGENDVHVRWDYQNATWDWWWEVDSVVIAGCIPPTPELELTKTVGTEPGQCATTDSIAVAPGTEVTYCYSITNTGAITITTHDLVDDQLGAILTGFAYDLAPGASTFITTTATILANTVNEASWTGTTLYGDSFTATDTATVTTGYNLYLPIIYGTSPTASTPESKTALGWLPWLALGPAIVLSSHQKGR